MTVMGKSFEQNQSLGQLSKKPLYPLSLECSNLGRGKLGGRAVTSSVQENPCQEDI